MTVSRTTTSTALLQENATGAIQDGSTQRVSSYVETRGAKIGVDSSQWIASGGTVISSVVNGGPLLRMRPHATALNPSMLAVGNIPLRSGAAEAQVEPGGIDLDDRVAAEAAGVVQGGGTEIVSNGIATGIVLQAHASAFVQAGGTAINFTASGQSSYIATYGSGNIAAVTSGATLIAGGRQDVGALWSRSGTIQSRGSAVAFDTKILSGTYQWVGDLGVTSRSVVSANGGLVVDSGGVSEDTLITGSGVAQVRAGGTFLKGVISGTNAYLAVYGSGNVAGVTSGATLLAGGRQDVGVLWDGNAQVSAGSAIAIDTSVNSDTYQWVASGGTALRSIAANGGLVRVGAGGVGLNTSALQGGNIVVSANGVVSGSVVLSSGSMTIGSGATSINDRVSSDGIGIIQNGGTAIVSAGLGSGITLQGGASAFIMAGGTAVDFIASGAVRVATYGSGNNAAVTSGLRLTNSAWQDLGINWDSQVIGSAKSFDTIIESGSYQAIFSGSTAVKSIVSSGGTLNNTSGSTSIDPIVLSGGTALIGPGGILSGGTVSVGGILNVNSNALLAGNVEVGGKLSGGIVQGFVNILSGGTSTNPVVISGGSLQFNPGARLSGLASLATSGGVTINSDTGGTVNLAGDQYASLSIAGSGNPTTEITGFNGTSPGNSDRIILKDVPRSSILGVSYPDADHVEFTLTGNRKIVLNIVGVRNAGFDLSDGPSNSTVFSVCYLAGTLIETPEGPVDVASLTPGDTVNIYTNGSLERRRLIWVGKKSVTKSETDNYDTTQYPIRFTAGSLGSGTPHMDLLVTPEHCMFIDGFLIPARMLVNGKNIVHDTSLKSFTYHHIETEGHDLISANGALSETYLDSGNRPDLKAIASEEEVEREPQKKDGCCDLPLNVSREFAEKIWKRLAGCDDKHIPNELRALDSELHILTEDDITVKPTRIRGNRHIFMIPEGAEIIYICSRAGRPSDVIGPFVDDRRLLGVLIGEISIFSGAGQEEIDVRNFLTHARGWHPQVEGKQRWTNGKGVLPLRLENRLDARILSIEVLSQGPYH